MDKIVAKTTNNYIIQVGIIFASLGMIASVFIKSWVLFIVATMIALGCALSLEEVEEEKIKD